jgi:hypothetical protein
MLTFHTTKEQLTVATVKIALDSSLCPGKLLNQDTPPTLSTTSLTLSQRANFNLEIACSALLNTLYFSVDGLMALKLNTLPMKKPDQEKEL